MKMFWKYQLVVWRSIQNFYSHFTKITRKCECLSYCRALYIMVVSFIGGGSRRTCCKSLTNFIARCCTEYTSPWPGSKLTTLVFMGTDCIGRYKSNYHTITRAPFCSNRGIHIFSRSNFIQWINAWNFEYQGSHYFQIRGRSDFSFRELTRRSGRQERTGETSGRS